MLGWIQATMQQNTISLPKVGKWVQKKFFFSVCTLTSEASQQAAQA
jgi:hypothetical protein